MKMKVLKTLIPSFILVIGLVFFLSITAEAEYTSTTSWNGNEDAKDVNQFGGSVSTQNAFKVWSVCKEAGFTDEEAAGVIANFLIECHVHSVCVEGYYGHGDTLESVDAYIESYSSKITDPRTMTQFTEYTLIHGYGVSPEEVAAGKAGTISTMHSTSSSAPYLDPDGYFNNGNGYLGIGLCQFTGITEHEPLFAFMDANHVNWWDIDNQLIFIFKVDGGYPKGGARLEQYKEEFRGRNASDCAAEVQKFFEMTNKDEERKEAATQIYQTLAGKGWDSKYGRSILDGTGFSSGKRVITHEGIEDRGIIESIFGRAVEYPRNTGFILNIDDREEKNKTVWKDYMNALKTDSKSGGDIAYSLFELYGEDVHWYNYFGENSKIPVLMDHIYSAYADDMTDELGFKEVFYTAYNYLSCRVYPDRPTVLTTQDVENGQTDPRVTRTISTIQSLASGYEYVAGTVNLTVCKFIVSFTSFLMGPEIRQFISQVITDIEESNFWEIVKIPLMIIVGLGIVAWIITFALKAVGYARNGNVSAKELITRFITLLLCLGLIFFAIVSPSACNKTVDTILNSVDEIFNSVLAKTIDDDEIIAVQDTSKATHAAIWKNAIFEPWVRGQFGGLEYNQLYTNYETNLDSGKSAMPQSNSTESANPQLDEPYFNSTKLTGDVFVYRGNGQYIRNWAAYLYSLGSPYHIDSTFDKTTAEKLGEYDIIFPNFTQKTTANDNELYADLFRVIDAQMDISPQYYPDGEVINNYTNSKDLDPSFISQSIIMIINCLLLIPFYPVILQKLLAFMRLIITLLKIMYYSIIEIFKEHSGLGDILPDLKKNFVQYVFSSMKLMMLVTIYLILVKNNIILMVVYILVAITILGFKLADVRQMGRNIKQNVNNIKRRFF